MGKILVVDDEPATTNLVSVVLQKDGHTIRTAENGNECLASLTEQTPDLIIMDVSMPEMDGFTLMTHLSGDGASRDIPVIVMSGKESLHDLFRPFTNVVDFISKPFDVKVLRDRVNDVLAKPGAR